MKDELNGRFLVSRIPSRWAVVYVFHRRNWFAAITASHVAKEIGQNEADQAVWARTTGPSDQIEAHRFMHRNHQLPFHGRVRTEFVS